MMPTFIRPPWLDTLPHPRPNEAVMSGSAGPRLLLLVPTTTYRTEDFVEAARRLDVELVVAAEKPNAAAALMREYARTRPIAAVVPVDDATSVVGAAIGEALGLRANAPGAVQATRDKAAMRQALARAGVRQPGFRVYPLGADPQLVATRVRYPCVLKPLVLSASRGVMRADDAHQFVAMWARLAAILAEPDVRALGEGARKILVEDFVAGVEVALEGLLTEGRLRTLAIFDKP